MKYPSDGLFPGSTLFPGLNGILPASVSGGPATFGRILTGRHVEQRVLDRCKQWSPTYLAELGRQTGREPDALPQVRAWTLANDLEKWPEDQLPAVLIISTGLIDEPTKEGRGIWRSKWALGIACIVSAARPDETSDLARTYAAAMRTLLLQHPPEGCFGITWRDESYDDIAQIDGRSISCGQVVFDVEYSEVVSAYRGPVTPPDPPHEYEEFIVQTVETEVDRVPITEEVP